MKKLYTEKKYKDRIKRRQKDYLKQLRREKLRGKNRERTKKTKSKVFRPRLPPAVIKLPEQFSLIKNIGDTIDMFKKFESRVEEGRPIYLDMSGVKYLTFDALLYLKSIIDYFTSLLSR